MRQLVVLLVALSVVPPLLAQPRPAPHVPPVAADTTAAVAADTLHIRAGHARYYREGGEWVSDLEGGVHLESDSTTVDSRRARAYNARGLAYFYEDVVVRDRGVVMTGNEGEFHRREDVAILRGNVRIRDRHGTIRAERARSQRRERIAWLWGRVDFRDEKTRVEADSVLYRELDGTGEAFGAVVITDLESGSQAFGTHAVYDRKTGMARLDPEPRLVLREKGAEDTEVRAADLQFNREQSVVRARGNVQIERGPTRATADSAILYRDENRLLLRGQPRLQREKTTMHGREIDVFYKGDDLDRVAVRHSAHLLQARSDTALVRGPNEVEGDSAQLYFDAGKLVRAVVVGNASSVFAPEERQADRVSRNRAQADSIVMRFQNDELEEVVFIGNASGTYRFFEGDLEQLRRPSAAVYDSAFGVVRGDTTGFDFESRAETVNYSAETIIYLAGQNDLHLQRAAEVHYQGRILRAGRIHYDADTDLLDARDRPALDDAGDRMYGERMGYDLGTREAWIRGGSTQYDQGFYTGQELRKVEEGVLQVRHASYTTCNLAHPHYRFECDRMKIYLRKKLVGRSVGVYLGNVPVFWLPFIYNSTETGRRSGFLQPDIEFGIGSEARYVRGLQYYWAASDYYDFLFSGDYLERSRPDRSSIPAVLASDQSRSVRLSALARYRVRYKLDGNVDFNFRRQFDGPVTTLDYTITGAHSQTLDERTSLRGNVNYASSSRAVESVYSVVDYQRSLERNLRSGVALTRRGDNLSFNAAVQRTQLLNPGARFSGQLVGWTLPDVRLTFRTIRLAPRPRDPKHELVQAFFNSLQFNPFLNFTRTTSDNRLLRDAVSLPDSGSAPEDSFRVRSDERITANTGLSLGRQVRAAALTLSPSVSYTETYVRDTALPAAPRHTRRVAMGLGGATTVYGLFYPKRFGIEALRHRVEPRAGLSFTPEIRGQQRRSQSLTLQLTNVFDAKVKSGTGTRRVDGVLDWSLSTGYNPTVMGAPGQPDRKFANISSTITINRQGPLRVSISQEYDPYRGRIIRTSVPFGMRLGGRFGYGETGVEEEAHNRVVEEEGMASIRDTTVTHPDSLQSATTLPHSDASTALSDVERVQVGGGGNLEWGLSFAYTLTRIEGRTERARVPLSFRVQPARNWEVAFSTTYDATTRELGQPSFRISRDLHCWKATFTRVRTFSTSGGEWQYYFRIFVNRHPDDLFIESGDRSFGYIY